MLVDSHCHLNFPALKDNLTQVIQSALSNEVKVMQTICTQISDIPDILKIIETYKNIWGSIGIHPHHTDTDSLLLSEIKEYVRHKKIIGIGETGLDYYYNNSDFANQKKSFVTHIQGSSETKLPIIIHTRNAEDDTADILSYEMKNNPFTGLLHCFTSSKKLAQHALDLGLYISISGICTFKNSQDLRDIIKYIPLDRLLIETDAPYLAPVPMRGKTNEPSFVKYVAQQVAAIHNIAYEQVCVSTTKNFFDLFKKCKYFDV